MISLQIFTDAYVVRHLHHTRSGVPRRMYSRRPRPRESSSATVTTRVASTENGYCFERLPQASSGSLRARWQGAMCVRRMIKKAHALRLTNSLILCYGLRSFHRPSVPPSRVVNKRNRRISPELAPSSLTTLRT